MLTHLWRSVYIYISEIISLYEQLEALWQNFEFFQERLYLINSGTTQICNYIQILVQQGFCETLLVFQEFRLVFLLPVIAFLLLQWGFRVPVIYFLYYFVPRLCCNHIGFFISHFFLFHSTVSGPIRIFC